MKVHGRRALQRGLFVASCFLVAGYASAEERVLDPTELISIARTRSAWCFNHEAKDDSCSILWRMRVGADDQVTFTGVASFEDDGTPMRLRLTMPVRWDRGGFCYDLVSSNLAESVYHAKDNDPATTETGRKADPELVAMLQKGSSVARRQETVTICWSASMIGYDSTTLLLRPVGTDAPPTEVLTASDAQRFTLR